MSYKLFIINKHICNFLYNVLYAIFKPYRMYNNAEYAKRKRDHKKFKKLINDIYNSIGKSEDSIIYISSYYDCEREFDFDFYGVSILREKIYINKLIKILSKNFLVEQITLQQYKNIFTYDFNLPLDYLINKFKEDEIILKIKRT